MTAPLYHKDRIREQLHHEISWVVSRELSDPRVPAMLTITEVQLGDDMRNATVYVSVFGEEKLKKEALAALNHAAPFIQKLVAQQVRTRNFPKLYFKLDRSIDRGQRINELLKEIKDDLV